MVLSVSEFLACNPTSVVDNECGYGQEITVPQNTRQSIPKRLRFEVFKRDSFKCRYCGRSAPEVLLQIDHLEPVSEGGTNEILNLLTACVDCNLGKSDKRLTDRTVLDKQLAQLEEQQERKEQMEMMFAWKKGLRDLDEQKIDNLCAYWADFTPGRGVSEIGRKNLKTWLRRFSLEEVLAAMDIAANQYLEKDNSGAVSAESWNLAFGKIPGICVVKRRDREVPDQKERYYVLRIIKNRFRMSDRYTGTIMDWLNAARSWCVPWETLTEIAKKAQDWKEFAESVNRVIEEHKGKPSQ